MSPAFQPFNPHEPVEVYHRNLPHWRQAGATYFTTFRLADSIPRQVLAQWNLERKVWLESHGIVESMDPAKRACMYSRINMKQREHFERDLARRHFRELDRCSGECILKHPACRDILHDAMFQFHEERYWAGDFVIMPNHVHWIIQPRVPHALEQILQSIKRFTSSQTARLGLRQSGRLWQRESHDHIIRNLNELRRVRRYIRENPSKARLKDGQYFVHSAKWLDD